MTRLRHISHEIFVILNQSIAMKTISKVMDDLDDETIKKTVLPKAKNVFLRESDVEVRRKSENYTGRVRKSRRDALGCCYLYFWPCITRCFSSLSLSFFLSFRYKKMFWHVSFVFWIIWTRVRLRLTSYPCCTKPNSRNPV